MVPHWPRPTPMPHNPYPLPTWLPLLSFRAYTSSPQILHRPVSPTNCTKPCCQNPWTLVWCHKAYDSKHLCWQWYPSPYSPMQPQQPHPWLHWWSWAIFRPGKGVMLHFYPNYCPFYFPMSTFPLHSLPIVVSAFSCTIPVTGRSQYCIWKALPRPHLCLTCTAYAIKP